MRAGRRKGVTWIGLAAVGLGWPGGSAAAETYKLDAVHSTVLFRIKHLNVSYSYGRFTGIAGKFTLDENDPSKNDIDVKVRTATVDTGDAKRDKHLEGPDFFDAKQFPMMTFKSKSFSRLDGNMFEVTGDLTCHGVTKEITVQVEFTGSADSPQFGKRAGLETTFTLNRHDYGITYMPGGLGDDVRVTVSLEGIAGGKD